MLTVVVAITLLPRSCARVRAHARVRVCGPPVQVLMMARLGLHSLPASFFPCPLGGCVWSWGAAHLVGLCRTHSGTFPIYSEGFPLRPPVTVLSLSQGF